MTKPRRYVYEIIRDHRDHRPMLSRRPILKDDGIWVTVPHRSKHHVVTRLLRHQVITSEREAWRRYLPKANEDVMGARRRIRWAERDRVKASIGLSNALVERARVRRLAGRV